MSTRPAQTAEYWLQHSDLVFNAQQVHAAIDVMAQQINQRLQGSSAILMCVMQGGSYISGQLMARISVPARLDYIHLSRYNNGTTGSSIVWSKLPALDLSGQTVLLMDDILDEGITIAEAKQKCLSLGAKAVLIAVLTDKSNGQQKPVEADFVGLTVPNRYVFGCGMDVYGWWRNLPEIRALTI